MPKSANRVLFIGRFQPFHRGHLSVVEAALKKYDHVIIAIGSADKSRTQENPFTVGERHAMIKAALVELGINNDRYAVVPITDIDDDLKWPKHVVEHCSSFETVITGNDIVKNLFEQKTKKIVVIPRKKYNISATDVRQAIEQGDDLVKYLHSAVIAFLQKIGATRKLVDIDQNQGQD